MAMGMKSNGRLSIGSQGSFDDQLSSVAEEPLDEDACDVVVIAVNSTDRSEQAFNWYVDKIHHADNRVFVVCVTEQRSLTPATSGDTLNALVDPKTKRKLSIDVGLMEATRDKYEKKMKAANLSASSQFISRPSSRPGEAIVALAAELDADLIVIGSRGLSRLRLTVSNSGTSVSEYVALNAHCPVVVCRNTK